MSVLALARRLPTPALLPQHSRPIISSVMGLKRLRRLQDEADRQPGMAQRQLALMQAANEQKQSQLAIRRFESGNFASDQATYREYVRALALTNQLDRLSLTQLGGAAAGGGVPGGYGAGASYGSAGASYGTAGAYAQGQMYPGALGGSGGSSQAGGGLGGASVGRGTIEQPLHVQYHESARSQLLRLLQRVVLFGIAAGGLMMLVDEKSLPKGLGLGSTDVQPVQGSPKRFSDVVGVDEAKEDLQDIVKYLRQPKTFTRLGGKLPKEAIFDAILNPNAGISMGFETAEVKLRGGGQAMGIVRSDTSEELVLALPGGSLQKFAKTDVQRVSKLPTSLMPSGLNQALTKEDLVDLVAYLSNLKAGAPK